MKQPEYPTPKEVVSQLNHYIIGQEEAKMATAIALRSRWRRLQTPEEIRNEIIPQNILMVGPTGVGKTEICRRLAALVNCPFVKVEAPKFTEVGYHGRDVVSIIRDLLENAMEITRHNAEKTISKQAEATAKDRLVHILSQDNETPADTWAERLTNKDLDNDMIELDVNLPSYGVEIMTPVGMEDMGLQLQDALQQFSQEKSQKKKMSVADAWRWLIEEEMSKLLNEDELRQEAIQQAEEHGIVFIDEIDKVIKTQNHQGDVSREGVQRDLLPLLEGTTIGTKYGNVRTDHILFIASGAFMHAQPRDMISELQGRLPIRVHLKALSENDFVRILTEPKNSWVKQYQALLRTESVDLAFTDCAIEAIAKCASVLNSQQDNIGARRLPAVIEKLLMPISYNVDPYQNQTVTIDEAFVNKHAQSHSDTQESDWLL